MIYYIVLLIMTLLGSIAALFLKRTAECDGLLMLMKNINLYIGAFLYLLSAVLNIYVLHYLNYSVVLPLTSLTYIWTMILSYKILNEKITKRKIAGVSLILLGAICVAI